MFRTIKIIFSLSILLLFCSSLSFAKKSDSLLKVWNNKTKPESVRMEACFNYAIWLCYYKPDSAQKTISIIKKEANSHKNIIEWEKMADLLHAVLLSTSGKQTEAVNLFDQLKIEFHKIKSDFFIGKTFLYSAFNYSAKGEYKLALNEALQAETYFKISRTEGGELDAIRLVASCYVRLGNYPEALSRLHLSLKKTDSTRFASFYSEALMNIGQVYMDQNDFTLAQNYFLRALKLRLFHGDTLSAAYTENDLAVLHYYNKEYKKALIEFEQMTNLFLRKKFNAGLVLGYMNIGRTFCILKNADSALYYENKARVIAKEKKESTGDLIFTAMVLGEIYLLKKEYSKAISYFNEADNGMDGSGEITFKRDIAEGLYKCYLQTKNYQKALISFEIFTALRDSISNDDSRKKLIRTELHAEYEKKSATDSIKNEEEIKVKDAKFETQNAQLKQEQFQRYGLIIGFAFVLAGLAFVINRYRLIKKQKILIEEQKLQVDEAFHKLDEKNTEVLDSIRYAKRIQKALITSEKYIEKKINQLTNK